MCLSLSCSADDLTTMCCSVLSCRVYSRFLANVPYVQEFENATASLFHTFTAQAVLNYRQCFSKTSVRHCAYNATLFSNAVVSAHSEPNSKHWFTTSFLQPLPYLVVS